MQSRLIIVLPFLLSACVSNPPQSTGKTSANYACDFLPEKPAPIWVQEESSVTGFYLGKGSAAKASGIEEQRQLAKSSALKNLTQSIRVSVQNDQQSSLQVRSSGQQETVAREVRESTRISSDLTLQKVEDAGEWLDRKSCTYWVRVRLSESALRFERLRALIAELKDSGLHVPVRRDALESAEALLPQIDFTRIPDAEGQDYYRTLLAKERQTLLAQKTDALAVILLDAALPATLARDALAQMPGGELFKLENLNCDRLDACVNQSRRHGARHLLFGKMSHTESAGKMGGKKGSLSLELTLVETSSGKTIWGPKRSSEAMLTFTDFSESDWQEAIKNVARTEALHSINLCLAAKEMKTCS